MLSPFTYKIVNVYNYFGNLSFYDSLLITKQRGNAAVPVQLLPLVSVIGVSESLSGYTSVKITECFINIKQVFLLYQLGDLVRL